MKEITKMTQEGYNELEAHLQELIKEFNENEKAMTRAYKNSDGDGAHDNAEFDELQLKERLLVSQIDQVKERLERIEIIEVEQLADDQVNIGDTLNIRMIFDKDDSEYLTITLIGGDGKSTAGLISINSPLGKAVYKQKIGALVSYEVNSNPIVVEIIEKLQKDKVVQDEKKR